MKSLIRAIRKNSIKIQLLFRRIYPKYKSLIYLFYFFVLLFSFHFIYLFWSGNLGFYPLKDQVYELFNKASALLLSQSVWTLNMLHVKTEVVGQTIYVNAHKGYVGVSPGCTSLKQWMHWLFLMLLFPGPWKHKLWFIPLGLVMVEFINVLRIVGLALVVIPWPNQFGFFHDYFFRPVFYLLIFLMWVAWVEWFVIPREKEINGHKS